MGETSAVKQSSMTSPLEVLWDWGYEIEQDKLDKLYEKAKRDQWNASVDIDWSVGVDPGGKILDESRMAFLQLDFFKKLSASQREDLNAHYSAYILSQILHGEQGALMVAGQLVSEVPDYEAKLYSASQAMDEARHVEVFGKYIRKLDKIYPVTEPLYEILQEILEAEKWQAKTVGMQVMIEGLALASFINVRASTGCSLLRQLLEYVTKDEARHVAFGNLYLTESISQMHPDDRAEIEDFTLMMTRKFLAWRRGPDGMKGFEWVLEDVGIDPADFVAALHVELSNGFKMDATPGSVHSFRGLIMPGIIRAGLVSDRVRPGYEEAKIKLFSDVTLLEELEASGQVA